MVGTAKKLPKKLGLPVLLLGILLTPKVAVSIEDKKTNSSSNTGSGAVVDFSQVYDQLGLDPSQRSWLSREDFTFSMRTLKDSDSSGPRRQALYLLAGLNLTNLQGLLELLDPTYSPKTRDAVNHLIQARKLDAKALLAAFEAPNASMEEKVEYTHRLDRMGIPAVAKATGIRASRLLLDSEKAISSGVASGLLINSIAGFVRGNEDGSHLKGIQKTQVEDQARISSLQKMYDLRTTLNNIQTPLTQPGRVFIGRLLAALEQQIGTLDGKFSDIRIEYEGWASSKDFIQSFYEWNKKKMLEDKDFNLGFEMVNTAKAKGVLPEKSAEGIAALKRLCQAYAGTETGIDRIAQILEQLQKQISPGDPVNPAIAVSAEGLALSKWMAIVAQKGAYLYFEYDKANADLTLFAKMGVDPSAPGRLALPRSVGEGTELINFVQVMKPEFLRQIRPSTKEIFKTEIPGSNSTFAEDMRTYEVDIKKNSLSTRFTTSTARPLIQAGEELGSQYSEHIAAIANAATPELRKKATLSYLEHLKRGLEQSKESQDGIQPTVNSLIQIFGGQTQPAGNRELASDPLPAEIR